MENIGDWLYFAVIVVAAVSSLIGSIGKKRKQAAEQQQQRQKQQPRDIFEEVIREIVAPQPSPQTYQKPAAKPVKVKPQRKAGIFGAQEGVSAFTTIVASPTELYTEEERPDITLEDLPNGADEWRKAFIYNEIFKRKY
jgi:hypothetical protein